MRGRVSLPKKSLADTSGRGGRGRQVKLLTFWSDWNYANPSAGGGGARFLEHAEWFRGQNWRLGRLGGLQESCAGSTND